jgi:hypothetical protein
VCVCWRVSAREGKWGPQRRESPVTPIEREREREAKTQKDEWLVRANCGESNSGGKEEARRRRRHHHRLPPLGFVQSHLFLFLSLRSAPFFSFLLLGLRVCVCVCVFGGFSRLKGVSLTVCFCLVALTNPLPDSASAHCLSSSSSLRCLQPFLAIFRVRTSPVFPSHICL